MQHKVVHFSGAVQGFSLFKQKKVTMQHYHFPLHVNQKLGFFLFVFFKEHCKLA